MSGLRDLDDRLLPRLAERLRALLHRAARTRTAVRGAVRGVTLPAAPEALRRLDDRYASRGPLAAVREVPQLGLLAVVAVFLVGSATAYVRSDGGSTGQTVAVVDPTTRVLGPEVGASVQGYVDDSRGRAVALSRDRPDALHVALVSFSAYARPDDVRRVLEGIEVQRAYLRLPSEEPTEVLSADVQDLVGDLRLLYTATAERKAEDQQEFLRLARSIEAANAEQQGFKDFYELSARLAGQEATAYRTGCACIFSVVVRATAGTLAELPALTGIRAVEVAPRGVDLTELRVRPLAPEQEGTVTADVAPRPRSTGP